MYLNLKEKTIVSITKTLPPMSSLINYSCEELCIHLSSSGNHQMFTFVTTTVLRLFTHWSNMGGPTVMISSK